MEIENNMTFVNEFSSYVTALIIIIILCLGLVNGVPVFDTFIEGAKNGLNSVFKIAPPLVGLMVAIGVFKASGILDVLVYAAAPITSRFGVPSEVLPLAFLRPISGSASLAMLTDIIKQYGADSLYGRMAAVMMGSTETTFYVLTVYFGSVSIKKTGLTIAASLLADTAGIIMSAYVCNLLF